MLKFSLQQSRHFVWFWKHRMMLISGRQTQRMPHLWIYIEFFQAKSLVLDLCSVLPTFCSSSVFVFLPGVVRFTSICSVSFSCPEYLLPFTMFYLLHYVMLKKHFKATIQSKYGAERKIASKHIKECWVLKIRVRPEVEKFNKHFYFSISWLSVRNIVFLEIA